VFDLNNLEHKARLTAAIHADIDRFSLTFDDGHRKHLGASLIGESCLRYLWYVFRWAFRPTLDPRMLRLWQRGHREEEWLWTMLRACGWTVIERDPTTNKQWRVSAVGGHFGGSLDAIGFPPPHYPIQEWVLLECKTNKSGENGRKWDELEEGGLVGNKPKHWAQASTYGYLKGLRIVVYFNVNKDDDRLFIDPRVLDLSLGAQMVQKAQFVIMQPTAPNKLFDNPSRYECKYCDARQICHFKAALDRNCRSCRHAYPGDEKTWHCRLWNSQITDEVLPLGCNHWQEVIQ